MVRENDSANLERIGRLETEIERLREGMLQGQDRKIAEMSTDMERVKVENVTLHRQMDDVKEENSQLRLRLDAWKSFLTRELVAVVIGGFLLLVFAAFLMYSMIAEVSKSEVFTNAFFILLGFFFGQTGKKMTTEAVNDSQIGTRSRSVLEQQIDNGQTVGAFVHIAKQANTTANWTLIDHPMTNGNRDAILSVTQYWNPDGSSGVYNRQPIGVWYIDAKQHPSLEKDANKWAIFNQDTDQNMPIGAAFNVFVR
jgi:hypothetical protein